MFAAIFNCIRNIKKCWNSIKWSTRIKDMGSAESFFTSFFISCLNYVDKNKMKHGTIKFKLLVSSTGWKVCRIASSLNVMVIAWDMQLTVLRRSLSYNTLKLSSQVLNIFMLRACGLIYMCVHIYLGFISHHVLPGKNFFTSRLAEVHFLPKMFHFLGADVAASSFYFLISVNIKLEL